MAVEDHASNTENDQIATLKSGEYTVNEKTETGLVSAPCPQKGLVSASYHLQTGDEDPTADELNGPDALRRISAPIPWSVYTVAFVELCERFSYYGTQVLCMYHVYLSSS